MKLVIKFFTLFLVFFIFKNINAQDEGLVIKYDYSFKYDTIRKNQIALLYIEKDKSYFLSEAEKISDSIIKERKIVAAKSNSKVSFRNLPEDDIIYFIVKKQNNDIDYYSNEFDQNFVYSENVAMKWTIDPDVKTILGHNSQKAEIKVYNKTFYAWFSEDLPFPDGPYKFNGLPGLILQLYDSENIFNFTAVGIEKRNMDVSFIYKQKYINTTKEKYLSYRKQYKEDPFQKMKALMLSTGLKTIQGKDGNLVNLQKSISEREKIVIDNYKKENQIEE